jgi:drug/metabolite transporter (DMT)-like permease
MSAAARPIAISDHSDPAAVLRGLGYVMIAMIVLPGQDAIAKLLLGPISPGQITWVRFALQTIFTLPFLLYAQGAGGLLAKRFWPNAARGALIAGSAIAYFAALRFMPIADAIAVFFVEPFILTVLSALIDKEHVSLGRKIAVAAGFIGVLVVVRPSYAVLGPVSLLPAGGGCLFAVYVLLNRRLSRFDTPLTMQFTAGLSATLIMTLCLILGWIFSVPDLSASAVDGRAAALLVLMGVLGTSGHLIFVAASRLAPSSLIAPFQYVEIIFAVILGFLVFGDFPDFWKWVGIAIVVASGAYVFWREGRGERAEAP